MGPSPSRNTVFPVEQSWSLGLQALLCSAGNVPVPPRGSATFFRRNYRPECVRHRVWASLVFALALSPFSRHVYRHVYRHFYRHFYRRWGLALKLALKLALNDGRRSVVDRGPGPRQGQTGRRERRRPAEASPLCQVRVWTTLFGKFTVGAWERQAPTRGAPSGARFPAGHGGPGPFTPLRCPGFGEGSPAVTNPQKSPRFLTRSFAAGRGLNFWGLVTAHFRVPRQRSRPTSEASLGLGLTSALPGGRSVGLWVARHTV